MQWIQVHLKQESYLHTTAGYIGLKFTYITSTLCCKQADTFIAEESIKMKYLLAVLMLNIGFSSCTGLSSKLPWMTKKSMKTAEIMSSRIHQRRDSDDDNLEIPDECFDELNRLSCQTGLLEQAVRVALTCAQNNNADSIAALCDTNAVGMLCSVYDFSDTLLIPAQGECLQSPLGDSCPSTECTNSLEAVRNSPPGCCVDALFNDTNSLMDNPILDYSLWSQCGVETFKECERTISREPIPNVTPCTEDEFTRQVITLQCSGQYNTILDQVEEMEQCSQIRRSFITLCQVNSRGENCNFVFNQTVIDTALNECNMDQTSCSDACREALETFRNKQGCCFNLIYNNTEIDISANEDEMFLASYALWRQCGVETPPLACRNLLDGTSKLHRKDLTILILFSALFVAIWNI